MLLALTLLGVMALAPGGQAQPPALVVSCAANPVAVAPGGTVQITTTGFSAQNRHISYSFKASSGKLTAAGSTATLHTAPDSPATITVTCNAVDDRGAEASKTATVTVRQP
jgi:hypothetical protein